MQRVAEESDKGRQGKSSDLRGFNPGHLVEGPSQYRHAVSIPNLNSPTFGVRQLLLHCQGFDNILDFYPPEATITPSPAPYCNNQKCLQDLPNALQETKVTSHQESPVYQKEMEGT